MPRYRPTSFDLRELVPPDIYKEREERAWELLNPYALRTLQTVRDVFGPIIVNDWHTGGPYKESGLRSFATSTGAAYSIHKFGGAFDCKSKTKTPRQMADYILAHLEQFPYLTTIENPNATPTWLHFDVRNHNKPGIWIVNP